MKRKIFFAIMALLCVLGVQAEPTSSWEQGFAAESYSNYDATNKTIVISTAAELAKMADDASMATDAFGNFKGWTITLANDIDLGAHEWGVPIGVDNNGSDLYKFMGTFDGQGHTISGIYYSPFYETGGFYGGLFGYAGSTAVIKNLTIDASTYTAGVNGGVIVGYNQGSIENCHVKGVTMTASIDVSYNIGGLVGVNEGSIVGCYSFANISEGTHSNGYSFGGIAGQNIGGTIQDCLYAGTITVNGNNNYIGGITGLCDGGTLTYNLYTCTTLNAGYYTDETEPTYNLGAVEALTIEEGTGFINYGNGNSGIPTRSYSYGQQEGMDVYPYGITLSNIFYYHTEDAVIVLEGDGSEESPYLITSEEDWNNLGLIVSLGYNDPYYFKQTADLTVSTKVGTGDFPFQSTYDGDGHTLTLNYGSSTSYLEEQYVAPFSFVRSCDIKNLNVKGTIYTAGSNAGTLIGAVIGSETESTGSEAYISNCTSNATIDSSVNGDGSHGGFVGYITGNSSLTFYGCLYKGTMVGYYTGEWGGFVGYCMHGSTVNFIESVCDPAYISIGGAYYQFIHSSASDAATFSKAYFTLSFGNAQGLQAYKVTSGNEHLHLTLVDETENHYTNGLDFSDTGFTYNGVIYGGSEEKLTIDLAFDENYDYLTLGCNEGTFEKSTSGPEYYLTFQNSDCTIYSDVVEAISPEGDGSRENPYIIASQANWNKVAANLNRMSYVGKKLVLANDITVDRMWGTEIAPFEGEFDGKYNGTAHKLTVNFTGTEEATAPFHHVNYATLRNITVDGVSSGGIHSAGLVGMSYGSNRIENCHVSTAVTCTGDATNGPHGGGIVGHAKESTVVIEGCLFDGSITAASDASDTHAAAFMGWCNSSATITITNCVEHGSYSNFRYLSGGYLFNSQATVINCAHTYHFQNWSGSLRARPISSATEELTFECSNTATTYDVAGLSFYGEGVKYDGNYYAGKGDVVSLALSFPDGTDFSTLTTSNGSITATDTYKIYELTLADDAEAVLSATFQAAEWAHTGAGTEDDPYKIYDIDQMNRFAKDVNSGTTFEGKYFQLMADITYDGTENNFAPIGYRVSETEQYQFSGSFDGDGHTISGINITRTGISNYDDSNIGLFGFCYQSNLRHAVIKNLTIANSSFTGYNYVAAVLGNNSGARIENCHVASDVSVNAVVNDAQYHAGIAGYVFYGGSIYGCTCGASITAPVVAQLTNNTERPTIYSGQYFGGIAGYINAKGVFNCLYYGTTVQGGDYTGAIFGRSSHNDYNTNNFYRGIIISYGDDQSVTHVGNNVGFGWCYDTQGPADGEGAERAYRRLSAPENLDTPVATYEGGLTAYENGIFYNGAYYMTECLELPADADNNDVIAENVSESIDIDVTLSNRTLTKDNKWTTLCLPFNEDLTDSDSPLYGATVRQFLSASVSSEGKLTIVCRSATKIQAGKPYFVKWTSGTEVANPCFDFVKLTAPTASAVESDAVTLMGLYGPVEIAAGDATKLFLADGEIKEATKTSIVNAFNAYFELNDIKLHKDIKSCALNLSPDILEAEFSLIGDVNGDGSVTIADVTALVNIILGKDNVQPYAYDHNAADVNGDESITIADVTALVNNILGKQ
ncbi:MAG: dockerin type I repeat-containing protein [Prevotella sp.]|nr:dockerin type I repeat-containing protein [Prevotella sp.]